MTDVERLEFEERERPAPEADEALVEISDVGVCGSDVHYYEHGHIGDFVVEDPLVLGHETAGTVAELGADVSGLSVGDRVALEPGVPCRRCEYCRRGAYHLCPDVTFMATPPDDGSFAEYVAWPADFVYPLPETVSLTEGALCEPLSVGIHASRRGDVSTGDDVLVTGSGPIGLVCMEAARAYGAGRVVVSDLVDRKLELAAERGADHTVNVAEETLSESVRDFLDGGADVVLEASGASPAYGDALDSVRRGGTIVCIGLGDGETPFDFVDLVSREVTVRGSFRYANTYPEAIDLLDRDVVDVDGLVDASFAFDAVEDAVHEAMDPEVVKAMVRL